MVNYDLYYHYLQKNIEYNTNEFSTQVAQPNISATKVGLKDYVYRY